MKKMLSICAVLMMALSAATALAADVTGAWTGEMKTPDGNSFQLSFNFKQAGATVSGSILGPQGDAIPISNGKIDGDKFSFDVSFNGMTIHHDCTVNGDEMTLTSKSDSGDFPGMQMTLKRDKQTTPPAAPAPPAQTPASPQ